MQVIASYGTRGANLNETTYKIKKTAGMLSVNCFRESGRQDSNLRPSAPKALNSSSSALGFRYS